MMMVFAMLRPDDPGWSPPMTPGGRQPYVGNRQSSVWASYKGREGPVEPATVAKIVPLFKQGFVDGLAPGLNSILPGSFQESEAPIRLIEKASIKALHRRYNVIRVSTRRGSPRTERRGPPCFV